MNRKLRVAIKSLITVSVLLASYVTAEPTWASDLLDKIMARGTLAIATDPGYPPQSELRRGAIRATDTKCAPTEQTANEFVGFDIDTARDIARRLGVEPCFVTPPWTELTAGNWGDRWDISVGSMTPTKERMEVLYFTQPYYATPAALFVHQDNTTFSQPSDLSGKRVGACTGCTYDFYLQGTLVLPGSEIDFVIKDAVIIGYDVDLQALHDTVCEQSARLEVQSAQLAEWNQKLEHRVAEQLAEPERVGRLTRFLSPQLAELIVSSEKEGLLESHRGEITVVFCDLRGFTAFSETVEPEEVMEVLREYHAAMGTLIFRFEGALKRFAGDGLMVFFNDPLPCLDPAARAVGMATTMRECVGELSEKWRKRGHQLGFGAGISQGYATLGKVGFEGRFDYAAIGTVTNLASRLCDEARPGQVLVCQRVYTTVEELGDVESLGELALSGLHRPVTAYNVLRLKGERTGR